MPAHMYEFSFEFPASLQYLTALRNAVQAFCTHVLEPETHEEQVYQVQLAVSELATNIIVHANKGIPDGTMQVRGHSSARAVTLEFFDHGRAYPERTPSLPEADSLAEGGYGSFIIQQCMDAVTYTREADGRNHWRLEKSFGATGGT